MYLIWPIGSTWECSTMRFLSDMVVRRLHLSARCGNDTSRRCLRRLQEAIG